MTHNLPTGVVTFLFTDIEGSSQLWEQHPAAMPAALARHDDCLRAAVAAHDGHLVKTTGDGILAVFATPAAALAAALAGQRSLHADRLPRSPRPSTNPLTTDPLTTALLNTDLLLPSRMGLHTGEAELREGDYHGSTLNRAARIMSIGHGGQVLLSAITAELLAGRLPPDVTLRDLGQHRLRGLSQPEHVYQVVAGDLPADFPPLRATAVRALSLPPAPTGFIGRWAEVDNILALLTAPGARLVSLVGPGGIGKTRLGIQAAATLFEREPARFADGVYFVPLAALRTAEAMPGAIAAALGYQFAADGREPRQQLLDSLRPRDALLVLDNMEQLIDDGGATLPADILAAAPGVRLLVTSRARLGIQGEQLYFVSGMSLPDPAEASGWADPAAEAERYSGLRMFLQAAGRVQPAFRLTPDNAAAVIRLCHQVQGMPLAIELAAGWLELLSPGEISAEIACCLDLLATELHGVPERQRSMRAVFYTTWQLASERERELLPPLAVFRAPFSREAAETVAGASLRDLLALANKSWLQRVAGADDAGRFQMHELLRQYAEAKLAGDEATAIRRRFAHFYAALWAGNQTRLESAGQKEALALLAQEYAHSRLAWEWLVAQGEFDVAIDQMLRPLARFAHMRGLVREVGDLVRAALAAARAAASPAHVLVKLLLTTAYLRYPASDPTALMDEAMRLAEELPEPERSLGYWYTYLLDWRPHRFPDALLRMKQLAGGDDTDGRATIATHLYGATLLAEARDRDAVAAAVTWLRRAAIAYERRGDRWAYASVCLDLSLAMGRLDDPAASLALLNEAQAIYEALGDWSHADILFQHRATIALEGGRPDQAIEALEALVAHSREHGNRVMETFGLGFLSTTTARYGNLDDARRQREQALALTRELAYGDNEPWNLWELGEVYRLAGATAEARRTYAEAQALFHALNAGFGLAYCERAWGDLALTDGDFAAAAEHFTTALTTMRDFLDQLWSQVYVAIGLARALVGLGRADEALASFGMAAATFPSRHTPPDLQPQLLAMLAEMAFAAGRMALAAAFCGLLAGHPLTWNETRSRMAALAARARAELGAEAADAAAARGRGLDLRALFETLAALPTGDAVSWLAAAEAALAA